MIARRALSVIMWAAISIASATLAAPPVSSFLRGLSLDVATALRWRVFGDAHQAASSPTVVIALDEETYRTPPFRGTPTVAWTGEIARVLDAVIEGGAKVVGFDVVFPTTIEDSEIAFDKETIGEKMRGFDRDFLRALASGAGAGKIVLGAIQTGDDVIAPTAGQRAVVGQARNTRLLNVYADTDGVIRRAPLVEPTNGRPTPTMALELASRALGTRPKATPGGVELDGHVVASLVPNAMTLNFDGGSDDVPSYSLADLAACAQKDDKDFFRRNFSGRVVLLGSKLDLEDLKLTSKRFAATPRATATERCASSAPATSQPPHGLIDGVFIEATAVNNLIRGESILELGDGPRWLIALAAAASQSAAALRFTPAGVALAFLALCVTAAAGGAVALHALIAAPLVEACVAGLIAIVATTAFRLIVTDRDKRLLRRNFEFYLAPAVVERIVNADKPPELGGEQREVTLFFSDLVKFSSWSETMPPHDVVELMNRYLTAMTDIIEAEGGFIDKYIGDAILGVFGAPLEDPRHAERAVRAALRCDEALSALNDASREIGAPALAHRIGLNSGPAVVGNIGSKRRFNYTVMGDAVNLASRLEGANKFFGTSIMAAERTVALSGSQFTWRELGVIRVKGRMETVCVFEPLAAAGAETVELAARAERYREGLALWRAGDFVAASCAFARFADTDPPSRKLYERSEAMARAPRPQDWAAVFSLD
jgi:class 3 adenylate cyclase/CHASE2 domain-containing sensor protein